MWRNISLSILTLAIWPPLSIGQPGLTAEIGEKQIKNHVAAMPMSFTENRGQWDSSAKFRTKTAGIALWFDYNEVIYELSNYNIQFAQYEHFKNTIISEQNIESHEIHLQFIDPNIDCEIIADSLSGYYSNYFLGNDRLRWSTHIPNYKSITYKNLYPGIDLKYYFGKNGIKSDFIIMPGADISNIKFRYTGIEGLEIDTNGDLRIETCFGIIYEHIPSVYQISALHNTEAPCKFMEVEHGIIGFNVDEIKNDQCLIIDPELNYSSYLGDGWYEGGTDIAADPQGNIYLTGYTENNICVYKLDCQNDSIIYNTIIGGGGSEGGYGIVLDEFNNSYIVGNTTSGNFPIVNPFDSTLSSIRAAFLLKLSPNGDSLIYSTYIEGTGENGATDIAIDDNYHAIITGYTAAADFPTLHSIDSTYGGGYDGFLSKFSVNGDSLDFSTYIGGHALDKAFSVVVDQESHIYVTGATRSDDFLMANPFSSQLNGPQDIFVFETNNSGDSLLFSTFFGGSSYESGFAIAIDDHEDIYVTGSTASPDFPTSHFGYRGDEDACVFALGHPRTELIFSSYLGGCCYDKASGIKVDRNDKIHITGMTNSYNFPIISGFSDTLSGSYDAFYAIFSPLGRGVEYSTFLGGNDQDDANNIVIDENGNAFIVGTTFSTNFPIINSRRRTLNGYMDIFISKFQLDTGISENDSNLPIKNRLAQNYPNPFNAQTTIEYTVTERSQVTISIFDILGRKVGTISESVKEPGNYQVIWDATGIPSGVYFYKITAGDYQETRRMTLLK